MLLYARRRGTTLYALTGLFLQTLRPKLQRVL